LRDGGTEQSQGNRTNDRLERHRRTKQGMHLMKIAVDLDGTCVDHKYPEVGMDVPLAVAILKDLIKAGHRIILYTMRSDQHLLDAIDWFSRRGIGLHGVQADPEQSGWTTSTKCYADIYIDDRSFGCPLIRIETVLEQVAPANQHQPLKTTALGCDSIQRDMPGGGRADRSSGKGTQNVGH